MLSKEVKKDLNTTTVAAIIMINAEISLNKDINILESV
jgi:hypothetical protein